MIATFNTKHSPAELCRINGWGPGTRLQGTETDGKWSTTHIIEITAVGQFEILARCVSLNGKPYLDRERNWELRHRVWTPVTDPMVELADLRGKFERLKAIAQDTLTCGPGEEGGSICFRDAIADVLGV